MINNSLDREKINRIDKSGLFTEYENWTNQAKDAIEIEPSIPKNQEFDNILFVGMGGSATSGEINDKESVTETFNPAQHGHPCLFMVLLTGWACHSWSGPFGQIHQYFLFEPYTP